jgi:alkylhydroperoxidase/carboxymuconolactone decarboxylase family protein YurZ
MSDTTETLSAIADGEGPVLESLTDMELDTLENCGLDEKTYTMLRVAALIAMDAPPVSYEMNVDTASGILDPEELQSILIAVAPVIGSARAASAAATILDAFFVDADADEIEEAADEDDEHLDVEAAEHIDTLAEDRASEQTAQRDEDEEAASDERELATV